MEKANGFVVHKYPDLDCFAALWLMKKFGGKKFTGVESAFVKFLPINEVNAEELAKENIITLDVGGGRFDHHQLSVGQENWCAAVLVARYLEVDSDPALAKLLEFVQRKDVRGEGIKSKDYIDQVFHVATVADNLNSLYPEWPEKVQEIMFEIFDSHYHTEKDWFSILEQMVNAYKAITKKGERIILINSNSPKATRASRFMKYDACVVQDPITKSVVIQWGPGIDGLKKLKKEKMIVTVATQLRLIESYFKQSCEDNNLSKIAETGEHCGWLLHESLNFVLNGSPKNPPKEPTIIPPKVIVEMVACGLEEERPFPIEICAGQNCSVDCFMHKYNFLNCEQFKKKGVER